MTHQSTPVRRVAGGGATPIGTIHGAAVAECPCHGWEHVRNRRLRLTTAGESHGPGYVGILDGIPPGLELSEADLQPDLDRRRPGQSKLTTQRNEPDQCRILSGVFEGRTNRHADRLP